MAKYLFIIGAGASKAIHPNFPTGAELIEKLKIQKESIEIKVKQIEVWQNNKYTLAINTGETEISEHGISMPREECFQPIDYESFIQSNFFNQNNSIRLTYNNKIPNLQTANLLTEIFTSLTIESDFKYIKGLGKNKTDENYYQIKCSTFQASNYSVKNAFIQLHINAENDLLDLLITELIAKFKPESIDYFVQEDIKTKLINYVAKAKELNLLKKSEDLEELEKKVSTRIIERIVEILKDLTFKDYTNTWLYNILVNKIRLNSAEDVKFITFNYDLNIENIVKEIAKTDDRINSMPKVEHVYGNLKDGIHLMERKPADYGEEFLKAENIYFIGYGFDDLNNKNLGLVPKVKWYTRKWKDKKIFIHNYGGNSALEYKVSSIFKANFEFTREESRRFIDFSRNLFIFISEKKDINEVLSNDFFFEK